MFQPAAIWFRVAHSTFRCGRNTPEYRHTSVEKSFVDSAVPSTHQGSCRPACRRARPRSFYSSLGRTILRCTLVLLRQAAAPLIRVIRVIRADVAVLLGPRRTRAQNCIVQMLSTSLFESVKDGRLDTPAITCEKCSEHLHARIGT